MALHPHDSQELRKARGAFFTPELVARYVTEWAVRSPTDRVLEPSCGEAAFLLEAGRRLDTLGAPSGLPGRLNGAELHKHSANTALNLLTQQGYEASIAVGDFLRREPEAAYDAVIGNPPYVRYQAFSGESRAAAQRAALRAGVSLTSLASSWAAFTVHSALHVRPGGRLGLEPCAERVECSGLALHLDLHASHVVEDPARETQLGRETEDEGAEADPLDRARHLDAQPPDLAQVLPPPVPPPPGLTPPGLIPRAARRRRAASGVCGRDTRGAG